MADGEQVTQIDPSSVYFTFSRIRPQFSCGRRVEDTLQALVDGSLKVEELPTIAVLLDGQGNLFSLNNRRMFVYKELQRMGLVQTVPARVRPVPNTKRMATKYSPDKCSLTARLKGAPKPGGDAGSASDGASEPDEDSGSEVADATPAQPAPAAAASGTQKRAAKRQARAGKQTAEAKAGARDKSDDLAAQLNAVLGADRGSSASSSSSDEGAVTMAPAKFGARRRR